MLLPQKIQNLIESEAYNTDDYGMSGSCVLLFEEKVLKIQNPGPEAENELSMLQYLQGKLPVPKIYAHVVQDGKSYLLMEKCPGEMDCSESYMENPALQARLLAHGLKRLWAADMDFCPGDWRLERKLEQARYNIDHGLVDMDNVEPDTFGEKGFADPDALLEWLWENRPKEDLALSHGDYCLPNIFGMGAEVSGYIDLGRTGIADKWCDIALCYRSLSHNYSGRYHGRSYGAYDDLLLFRELGLEPDWEKIRYYILLDELF